MSNRLARESSPYLLQHKDNPVDWYPWGDEAFARARRENKPIFLSVGYSTCHWCHVMEHESFEDPQIASLLNEHFVSIKVDREERPDVDRVYMTFVQATTGSGGWPMSVWLTPALEPFYGGTYFPPQSRWGRPGFDQVLAEIARVWRDERGSVLASAADIVEQLRRVRSTTGDAPDDTTLEQASRAFVEAFDRKHAGFGDAPKFPRPSELLFLLREHVRTGSAELREMALATLRAMALGGMRDHIGGGFHRYSVDAAWRVPHFEKMLYDQAQLVLAFLEGAQASGDWWYGDVAADTLEYVLRDLQDPAGGFCSAEDADSVPPESANEPKPSKREGAFYVWRDDEIGEALGPDADVFRLRFGIRPDGNAPADPHGEFAQTNLLYVAKPVAEVASETNRTEEDVTAALARARAVLMARRAVRPRPGLDDKVLTAWNGLTIAAFARAARTLENGATWAAAARRAAQFIRTHLWDDATGTVLRRYRRGERGIEGYAEDYAYLVFGLLELFQSDGDPAWLEWAVRLQRTLDERFWDAEQGGWFGTTGGDASVLLRLKDEYDGAEPAASSVAVGNLIVLSQLIHETGEDGAHGPASYHAKVERTFRLLGARTGRSGRTMPMLLAAFSTYHAGMTQVVVAGDPGAADTQALQAELRQRYVPGAIVVPIAPAHRERLTALLPWTADLPPRDGRATAYVCRNFTCLAPATTAAALRAHLDGREP